MASKSRSTKHSVKEQLQAHPYRFSFVQSCRLLEQICTTEGRPNASVGYDAIPSEECVRFAALPTRSFPPTEVAKLTNLAVSENGSHPQAPKLTVTFMGLFGPSGVLPHHDTQRIIDAGNKKNPERDFLDVFNHRILSLFYRASTKYRVPFSYETHYRQGIASESLVTTALYSTAGMGTGGLRGRLEVMDELSIEFAALFALQPKSSVSLQRILNSYFGYSIAIQQFVGQWRTLSAENKSEMPAGRMLGQNCALGREFILGDRIWDISGKFRVIIGPLTQQQFSSFLPGSINLVKLAQITQLYVGGQFDFDVQLELIASEVPPIQLGGDSQLGFNTWLISTPPSENKNDAVFVQSGVPLESKYSSAA